MILLRLPPHQPRGFRFPIVPMALVAWGAFLVFAVTDNPVRQRWDLVMGSASRNNADPNTRRETSRTQFDADTVHPGATLLLASTVSLVVCGLVFVAGRSQALAVSGGFLAGALALLVVGLKLGGGLGAILLSLAIALVVGLAVGWTTLPIDET